MKKEILEKWDNTCIKVLSKEHGKEVIKFWQSVGVDTKGFAGDSFSYCHYGLFDGNFNNWDSSNGAKVLTLEEAIAIRNNVKTFPREMYVWDFDIEGAEKEMVYFIVEKSMEVDQPVLIVNGKTSFLYGNAMEIEEYEALTKKQNENDELIKQIEKTEKELAELKSKLT